MRLIYIFSERTMKEKFGLNWPYRYWWISLMDYLYSSIRIVVEETYMDGFACFIIPDITGASGKGIWYIKKRLCSEVFIKPTKLCL